MLARMYAVTRSFSIIWRFLTAWLRRRPNVFVLGEVRCGTTSVSSLLRSELGMVGPFTPWIHPLAEDKESFYFVGHYWGMVAPSLYRMAYPLKLVSWARRVLARKPPQLCFDGCASYFSAPWVPQLLKRIAPRPVLVVCLREPVSQNLSWWRLEQSSMAWGSAMEMGDEWLEPPDRVAGYPPASFDDALMLSRSDANEESWSCAERLFLQNDAHAAATNLLGQRLPSWAIPFPNGQLSAFDRMGRYADSLARWQAHFDEECFVVVTLEELDRNPASVLQRVAEKCVQLSTSDVEERGAGQGTGALATFSALERAAAEDCMERAMRLVTAHEAGDGNAVRAPKLNQSPPIAPHLEPTELMLRELAAYYRPHNLRLFSRLGRDLGWHEDKARYPWYASSSTSAATLSGLPMDVLSAVLAECSLHGLGGLACTSQALRQAVESCGPWEAHCQREGLVYRSLAAPSASAFSVANAGAPVAAASSETSFNTSAFASPRERLRRAALCNHAESRVSSTFSWDPNGLSAACISCSRSYSVTITRGFVDNNKGASMMVTRVNFTAAFAAPDTQRTWTVDYDGRAAAALKAATNTSASGSWQGVTSLLDPPSRQSD